MRGPHPSVDAVSSASEPSGLASGRAPGSGLGPLKIALIVSVTLNMLALGVVLGELLPRRQLPPKPMEIGLGPFDRGLTEADRDAIAEAAQAGGVDARALDRAGRVKFERIVEAIGADPFDPEALATALREHRLEVVARIELAERLLRERLSALSPEARDAFVARMQGDTGETR